MGGEDGRASDGRQGGRPTGGEEGVRRAAKRASDGRQGGRPMGGKDGRASDERQGGRPTGGKESVRRANGLMTGRDGSKGIASFEPGVLFAVEDEGYVVLGCLNRLCSFSTTCWLDSRFAFSSRRW